MKKYSVCLLGLLLAAGLLGCSPVLGGEGMLPAQEVVASPSAATPLPVVTPVPTPAPAEYAAALEAAWREAFLAQPLGEGPTEQTVGYDAILAELPRWQAMTEQLYTAAEDAFLAACEEEGLAPQVCTLEYPGWKMTASLYHRFGPRMQEVLAKNSLLEIAVADGQASMEVHASDLRALIAREEGELRFGPKLTYAYLNTVYDDAGEEISFTQYPLTEDYLKNLQDPLPGHHIKDGWYKDRDRGKRKHTGTDIRAQEDTPILSCTDGTVMNIGCNEGAGNYVVVLDDNNIEYHYYHMVRLTDFLQVGERVQKGDCVGNIGNTGNSVANHLHLTVISPDYTYINPYPMLKEMRKLQQ